MATVETGRTVYIDGAREYTVLVKSERPYYNQVNQHKSNKPNGRQIQNAESSDCLEGQQSLLSRFNTL